MLIFHGVKIAIHSRCLGKLYLLSFDDRFSWSRSKWVNIDAISLISHLSAEEWEKKRVFLRGVDIDFGNLPADENSELTNVSRDRSGAIIELWSSFITQIFFVLVENIFGSYDHADSSRSDKMIRKLNYWFDQVGCCHRWFDILNRQAIKFQIYDFVSSLPNQFTIKMIYSLHFYSWAVDNVFFSRSHLPIDFLEDLILRKYCFWRGFKAFQVSRWYRSLGQEEAMTNSTRVVSINCGNIVVQSSDAVHTVRLSGLFGTDLLQIRFWTYRKSARIDCKIENWALLNRSDCNTGFQKIILSSRLRLKSHNNQFLDVWADSS